MAADRTRWLVVAGAAHPVTLLVMITALAVTDRAGAAGEPVDWLVSPRT